MDLGVVDGAVFNSCGLTLIEFEGLISRRLFFKHTLNLTFFPNFTLTLAKLDTSSLLRRGSIGRKTTTERRRRKLGANSARN